MINSYRTHEDQREDIARSMKALFPIKHAEPEEQKFHGTVGTCVKRPKHASTTVMQLQKSSGYDCKDASIVPNDNRDEQLLPILPYNPVPELRCIRCSDRFPVTDFLYTKKTGLCISCWEAKVA